MRSSILQLLLLGLLAGTGQGQSPQATAAQQRLATAKAAAATQTAAKATSAAATAAAARAKAQQAAANAKAKAAGKGNTKKDEKKKKKKKDKKPKKGKMLFDPAAFRSFNIAIDPIHKAKLDADPAAEEYYPCQVTVNYGQPSQEVFNQAGCRYKGSVGSLRICIDPVTGRADGTCRKLSWKVDANKFKNGKQKIWGQKKLVFNGLAVDHSLMSERLAYGLIKNAGLAAPRAVHAKIYVNHDYDGVYSLVEAPDEEFTEREFGKDVNDGKGALYKDALLESQDPNYYKKHRETGKNEDAWMASVAQAMRRTTPNQDSARRFFETYFDVDSVINVTAINTVLGMTDDWRKRHNFFWYVEEKYVDKKKAKAYKDMKKDLKKKGIEKMPPNIPKPATEKKLVMIPWDYDRINDEMAKDRNAPGAPPNWYDPMRSNDPLCTQQDPSPQESASFYPRAERNFWIDFYTELPPGLMKPINCDHFTKLLAAAYKDEILARSKYFAETVVSQERIISKLNAYSNQIQHKIGLDRDPPLTKDEWIKSMKSLRDYLFESRKDAIDPNRIKHPNRVPTLFGGNPSLSQSVPTSSSFGGANRFGGGGVHHGGGLHHGGGFHHGGGGLTINRASFGGRGR